MHKSAACQLPAALKSHLGGVRTETDVVFNSNVELKRLMISSISVLQSLFADWTQGIFKSRRSLSGGRIQLSGESSA